MENDQCKVPGYVGPMKEEVTLTPCSLPRDHDGPHSWETEPVEGTRVEAQPYSKGLDYGYQPHYQDIPELLQRIMGGHQRIPSFEEVKERMVGQVFEITIPRIPVKSEIENRIRDKFDIELQPVDEELRRELHEWTFRPNPMPLPQTLTLNPGADSAKEEDS